MLSKFKRLPGLCKFNIVWNSAFLLIEAFFAVTLHSGWALALTLFFAAFLTLSLYQAKWELERQDRLAEVDAYLSSLYEDRNTRNF